MSRIKCIIVEDEPLAIKLLIDYIAKVPFLDLRGSFKDAFMASEFLLTHEVDLIFLDIHLPRLKGTAFLKSLSHPPAVIVTTAYHQYAVEGFTLNVTDYLLKPIEFDRFLVAVNKVRTNQRQPIPDEQEGKPFFFVSMQKKKVKISLREILYIESQREYVKIVTESNTYTVKMPTHEIEGLLPPKDFARIHRSFIISLNKVTFFTAEEIGIGNASIPVGRNYRDSIERLLNG